MRVLHVIPSVAERSGGPATAIVPMCRALQQQGVDVLLVTTDAGMNGAGQESNYKGVPAKFFPSQLGESFKYSGIRRRTHSRGIQSFFDRCCACLS